VADEDFRPQHQPNKQGLRAFLRDINTMLEQSGMQMDVRSTKDEDKNGDDIWALVRRDLSGIECSSLTRYRSIPTRLKTPSG
jgi:uncharacterized protein (DUF2336 family)